MTWIYILLFLCGIPSAHIETIIHSHQWWLATSVAAAAWWKCGCQSAPPPSDHCWTFTHGHTRPCGWDVLHKEADRDWDGAGFKPPTFHYCTACSPPFPPQPTFYCRWRKDKYGSCVFIVERDQLVNWQFTNALQKKVAHYTPSCIIPYPYLWALQDSVTTQVALRVNSGTKFFCPPQQRVKYRCV